MSLENWYRKKHRWDVPKGESLANFSLGMESSDGTSSYFVSVVEGAIRRRSGGAIGIA